MKRNQLSRNRIHIVQGFGNADLEFGDFVEVVLFGGEVEGYGEYFIALPSVANALLVLTYSLFPAYYRWMQRVALPLTRFPF